MSRTRKRNRKLRVHRGWIAPFGAYLVGAVLMSELFTLFLEPSVPPHGTMSAADRAEERP